MANFLSGFENECLRNISTVAACIVNVKGSQRKSIEGVQLDFVDDLFLDRFAGSERYSSYNVCIVGFAQHPASMAHWSFDRYRLSFQSKLQKAIKLQGSGVKVVWYLSPQYPHTRWGFPVRVRDWRTDVRLTMFNQFAKEECQKHGIPVVDAFSITAPMSHTSPDQAHYTNWVSFELVTMTLTIVMSQINT
jgi:hypothetical protein